jgi:hypothetical protein
MSGSMPPITMYFHGVHRDLVIHIFILTLTANIPFHNPSGHTMALGLTRPKTEMSAGNTSWG